MQIGIRWNTERLELVQDTVEDFEWGFVDSKPHSGSDSEGCQSPAHSLALRVWLAKVQHTVWPSECGLMGSNTQSSSSSGACPCAFTPYSQAQASRNSSSSPKSVEGSWPSLAFGSRGLFLPLAFTPLCSLSTQI